MMAVTPKRILSLTLTISLWIGFAPLAVANATDEGWLDRVTALVRQHQDVVEQYGSGAACDAYLIHLRMVRQALSKGDVAGTCHMMNQFMDMLESRAGGILGWSATALYDYYGDAAPVSRPVPAPAKDVRRKGSPERGAVSSVPLSQGKDTPGRERHGGTERRRGTKG